LLVAKLKAAPDVVEASVAGPGFINLRLADGIWRDVLATVLTTGTPYGDATIGKGEPINVEYVSANPTGPMHVGHARGAVVGDALARLLAKAGFAVTKEYYINDAGGQVDNVARALRMRYPPGPRAHHPMSNSRQLSSARKSNTAAIIWFRWPRPWPSATALNGPK